jgi:hypothetical protein
LRRIRDAQLGQARVAMQSIFLRRKMDTRVKPAGDACGFAALTQTNRRML